MTKSNGAAEILELPIKSLVVDLSLAGRSQKEINANAKELAPMMTAHGGWDSNQPGVVFEREGKHHLLAGFTRRQAAENAEIKTGFFTVVKDDPAHNRTAPLRTNAGKPVTAYAQGLIFVGMRDGTNTETAKPGEPILEGMSGEAIAKEIGVSRSWVNKCIAIAESPESIRQLIEDEQVAPSVVYAAGKLAKGDDAKHLRIVKKAIANANAEDETKATQKHFDAIKGEFAPKLKADTGKGKEDAGSDDKDEAPGGEEKEQGEAPASAGTPQPQSVMDLGASAPKSPSKKALKAAQETFAVIATKWGEDRSVVASDEDITDLWERLVEAGFSLTQSPL